MSHDTRLCLPPLCSYLQSPLRRPEGEYADMLAWAVEQAHDWEGAAAAGAQPVGGLVQVCAAGGRGMLCMPWHDLEVLGMLWEC